MASITKRGTTYAVVYDNGKDANGKRIQRWESGYTYRQAQKRKVEIEYRKSKSKEPYKNLPDMTLKEFIDLWLPVQRVYWQFNTYTSAESMLRNHVTPYMGDMVLRKIKPYDIDSLLSYLHVRSCNNPKRKKQNGTLSSTSIHHIHGYLRQMFRKAAEWGFVEESPVKCAPPKRNDPHMNIWAAEDVHSALEQMEENPILHLAIHMAFICSLRIGELLAITLDDIDLDDRSISITKTLQRANKEAMDLLVHNEIYTVFEEKIPGCNTALIIKPPKTPSCCRKVFLTASLCNEIRQRIERIKAEAAFYGWEHSGLLFCLPEDGTPIEPKLCQRWFQRWQERNSNLNYISFHRLRHSSTTYKLLVGHGDLKSVQADNGHANIKMTLDHYAMAFEENRRVLVTRMEEHFYNLDK